MIRTPVALFLSLALALPQLSAPAYADQRSYAHRHGANGPIHRPTLPGPDPSTGNAVGGTLAILGGLAVAAALAKEARDRREEREAREQRRRDAGRNHGRAHDRGHGHRHHGHGHRRATLKVLPERCFRQGDGPYGSWRGWSARCLQRHVAQPRLLPRRCLRTVETWRGLRDVYRGRCLRREGWQRQYARH